MNELRPPPIEDVLEILDQIEGALDEISGTPIGEGSQLPHDDDLAAAEEE